MARPRPQTIINGSYMNRNNTKMVQIRTKIIVIQNGKPKRPKLIINGSDSYNYEP